ncbi:MAG: DnaB-like helicase C-terminal domain-containing protein [Verrucomicrobia bacterium]|nr:DnaB-like helicase C-terminal domain-containing protein [Verrucomicrobiota bacterium]
MQLIGGGGGSQENRTAEVGRISKGLKAMAKELGIPVLALSQLNRDCEKNQREPELHDLREFGGIEQDTDLVGLLYGTPDPEKRKPDPRPYILKVDKNRNGPTGDVALVFHKTFTRYQPPRYSGERASVENRNRPR